MGISAPPEADLEGVLALARPEIRALIPYSHAQWLPALERLHANELPWQVDGPVQIGALNRYPEPQPQALLDAIATLYGTASPQILVGRGSDEAIDLLTRAFCRAGQDAIVITPPTFGMYAVAARIQGARVVEVPLDARQDFALDRAALLQAVDASVKLVFLCSPNNPTGTAMPNADILQIAAALKNRALVVVDEAYQEFSPNASLVPQIAQHANLVVLRTLSKAHGLAGARIGSLIARPGVVALLRRIIPPYALAQPTVVVALAALSAPSLALTRERIKLLIAERERLAAALTPLPCVQRVWPSAGNFLLVRFVDARRAFDAIAKVGLLVRDFSSQPALAQALRITIGSPAQNDRIVEALRS